MQAANPPSSPIAYVPIAYVKGRYLPLAEASLSIEERGFRFGDGVFETLRVAHGIPLFLEEHLARLHDGLATLRIPPPAEPETLEHICHRLIQQNAMAEGVLRLSVSRGIGSRGYLPSLLPATSPPTVVAEVSALPPTLTAPLRIIVSNWRKPSPHALPVQHKLMQGLNSTLARMEAADAGADEALLLNDAGECCEFSSSNLFWLRGSTLYTPAPECGLLMGITRQRLMVQWPSPVIETRIKPDDLCHADAVIATNSISGAQAVTHLLPCPLHPQPHEWPGSTALAVEANRLLEADEAEYVRNSRESG